MNARTQPLPPANADGESTSGSTPSTKSSRATASAPRTDGDARDDDVLMAAYKNGDVAAFRVLAQRHHAPVYRFCLRALRSP